MWWPRKPQPPITRTEVESLVEGSVWDDMMVTVFWCDWMGKEEGNGLELVSEGVGEDLNERLLGFFSPRKLEDYVGLGLSSR